MENKKVVSSYFEALKNNDEAKLNEIIDNNVIWHQGGKSKLSGIKKGKKELFDMIGKMMTISKGTFKIDKVDFISENGDLVNCLLNFRADAIGGKKELNQQGLDLMKIRDGKISEVWLFSSDQEAEDKYWDN